MKEADRANGYETIKVTIVGGCRLNGDPKGGKSKKPHMMLHVRLLALLILCQLIRSRCRGTEGCPSDLP